MDGGLPTRLPANDAGNVDVHAVGIVDGRLSHEWSRPTPAPGLPPILLAFGTLGGTSNQNHKNHLSRARPRAGLEARRSGLV